MRRFLLPASIALAATACMDAPAEEYWPETGAEAIGCSTLVDQIIEIETLIDAYAANEAAAQRDYGGRCLAVAGTVAEIDLDLFDEPVIRLQSDHLTDPSVRLAPEMMYEAAELVKGERTMFLCAEVSEFIGAPMLSQCTVATLVEDAEQ